MNNDNNNNSNYNSNLERCTKIFITWNKSFVFIGVFLASIVSGTYIFARSIGDLKEFVNVKSVTYDINVKKVHEIEKELKELRDIKETLNAIAKKLKVDK